MCTEPSQKVAWPKKVDLFGVHVSVTQYDELVRCILDAAHSNTPAVVSLFSVHSVIHSADHPDLRDQVNQFDAIGPDGQPVRWAMNRLYRTSLTNRVYGPETMLRICEAAAEENVPIYLFGSTEDVLSKLSTNLQKRFPRLSIAGMESPPFRELNETEAEELVDRVHQSGAKIFFVGLGCPKQDYFAFRFRNRLRCVQVAVGAAFDFHAGTKRTAPKWMQDRGLEWLFRLTEEPKRLWKRYLTTNSKFLWYWAIASIRRPKNQSAK